MSEHLTAKQLEQYRDWQLPEEELFAVDDHLSACELCRERFEPLTENLFPFSLPLSTKENIPRPAEIQTGVVPSRSQFSWRTAAAATLFFCLSILLGWAVFRQRPIGEVVRQSDHPSPSNSATPQASPGIGEETTRDLTQPRAPQATPSPVSALITNSDGGKERQRQPPGEQGDESDSRLLSALAERPAALADLVRPSGVTLKGPAGEEEFELLRPVGTVVMSDRPVFRWRPVPGATGYRVMAMELESRGIALNEKVTGTRLVPSQPLPRGKVLMWGVTALVGAEEIYAPKPPAPEARLMILDGDQAGRLSREIRTRAASHLAKGILYAREGLLDDAEREFKSELAANPRSAVARKLLRTVRSWRPARVR